MQKIGTALKHLTKLAQKWTKDVNVKQKSLKLLEDNKGQSLGDHVFGE